jgi:hypothetical protein
MGYVVLDTLYRGAQDRNHAACGAHADFGECYMGFN